SDERTGLMSCRIVSSKDGKLQVGSGQGYPSLSGLIATNPVYILWSRMFGRDTSRGYDPRSMHSQNHDVDHVSGACTLFHRQRLLSKGLLLDEDFFLYSEDKEWSYRVKMTHGLRNHFCGSLEI